MRSIELSRSVLQNKNSNKVEGDPALGSSIHQRASIATDPNRDRH